MGHNVELGRALGLTESQIDLLTGDDWRDSDLFSDKEKAAIWWADEVTNLRAKQNKAAFEAMEAALHHATDRGTDVHLRHVELVGSRRRGVAFGG